jgi:hypothetical protein
MLWEESNTGEYTEYWQPQLKWKISEASGGGWFAERGYDESFLPEPECRHDLSALMELCETMYLNIF